MNDLSKQITLIEEYVRFAETLPTQLSAVKVYLGYDTSDKPSLSPESMQTLFVNIKTHVETWKNISKQSRSQLRELSITAAEIRKNGSGLLRGLKALSPVTRILNTIDKTTLDASDFKGMVVPLDESTIVSLNRLQPYIDSLQKTSLASLGDTTATNNQIAEFRNESSKLEASLAEKVTKIKSSKDSTIGKEKTVGPMIDAYKEACARIVAQFGEGSEAAKAIQEQIEKTLHELTSRQDNLQKQQRLTYAIGRLFVHLQGLGYAMLDAQSSLTHLWLKSTTTITRLNNITTDLGGIKSNENLFLFYINLKKVIKDWTTIMENASSLYKSF